MKGLSSSQAEAFLKQYGLNIISDQKKKTFIQKFFEQFNNFLTILLITAAFFSLFLGETIDGVLIILIVVLNAAFGLYQEAKAEESLSVLKEMTRTMVRVLRDGRQVEIESKFLVPGDVVYLEEGIKISADGKIIESINLEINESALTGESLSVSKQIDEEVFSGTIVARGRGLMLIVNTGDSTKFGAIAKNISEISDSATPLQKKLEGLTRFIGIGGIILSVIVFLISILEGSGYFPAFLLSISLAVAVVPEGLPAVMTITLAIGMKTMAKKKAIIRKLSAIEALGSITLIATDKTGTLTTNKMQVKEIFFDNTTKSQISNLKSQINSKLQNKNIKCLEFEDLDLFGSSDLEFNASKLLLLDGILCSTASLVYIHDHGSWDVLGDPTEGALLYLAQKAGIDIDEERKKWKLIEEKPFDSVTKMMTVIVKNNKSLATNHSSFCFSKGAPESIIKTSNQILVNGKVQQLTDVKKREIEKLVAKWAKRGLRVLAFSYKSEMQNSKSLPAGRQGETNSNLKFQIESSQKNNIFLGMVAIHDEPRVEVKEAVIKARRAGIKIVMITGDNEKTAEAVGVSSGIVRYGSEILTGSQLDEYSDEELLKILPKVAIFARTNPFQKHRIVKLYQSLGEIVAVTGDGVNDAIALKQADVGVAMGRVGTDVARETADMVITDDNFATIITAIEEGRGIINNIKNAIKYLLSCNVSEAFALIIGLILGLPTLFYPIQLLYINLVTDGLPALMLSFSPRDPNVMS
ncbi:MAG: Calcium-translocating P-type ATPase, PMCA-type, partial [Candidatus Roizmanbacteria bacterium GW2011_GWC2_35_12]